MGFTVVVSRCRLNRPPPDVVQYPRMISVPSIQPSNMTTEASRCASMSNCEPVGRGLEESGLAARHHRLCVYACKCYWHLYLAYIQRFHRSGFNALFVLSYVSNCF